MKWLKLLILIIPVILLGQSNVPVEKIEFIEANAEWLVPSEIGTIMWIKGDSVLYEEAWMRIIPNKTIITDKSGTPIELGSLKVPCKVEISFFGKGRYTYIKSIKLLKQLQYTSDYYIIGDETITE